MEVQDEPLLGETGKPFPSSASSLLLPVVDREEILTARNLDPWGSGSELAAMSVGV